MFGIGVHELLIILVLVLVIFGAKKLPEIGGGLGKAIRNFKKGATEPDEIDLSERRNSTPQPGSNTYTIEDSQAETITVKKEQSEEQKG